MLRRGISQQRSPSVCAFCQHRLSWRRACSPHRRLLSSTKSLRDDDSSIPGLPGSTSTNGISTTNSFAVGSSGWGKPLFGGGRSSILPEKKTHADGGAPNNAVSQPHHGLLPHETEARNRLAAQEAVPERSGKAAQDRAAQPFDAPRKLWNSEMQQKILANIHREEKEARDAKPGRKTAGESLTGTPPIHIPSQQSPLMMKPLLPLSSTDKPSVIEDTEIKASPLARLADASFFTRKPAEAKSKEERKSDTRVGTDVSKENKKPKDRPARTSWGEGDFAKVKGPELMDDNQFKSLLPQSSARVEKGEQGMPSTGDWGMSTFAKMKPSGISEDNRAASRTAQWSSLSSTRGSRDLPSAPKIRASKVFNTGLDDSSQSPASDASTPKKWNGEIRPVGRGSLNHRDNAIYQTDNQPRGLNDSVYNIPRERTTQSWPPPGPLSTRRSDRPYETPRTFLSRRQQTEPGNNSFSRPPETTMSTHLPSNSPLNSAESWGSLGRKQQQGKPGGGDFWAVLDKKAPSPLTPAESVPEQSRSAPPDDWGKEFDDLPRMKRQTQSKFSNEPGPRSRREDRGTRETSAADDWEIKPASQVPTVVHEFVNRNQNDPDRDDRFEIHRVRAKDRKGGKPRGQRKARYDDPGEEGDGYEEWLDRPKHKKLRRAIREAERTEPRPITLPELISISHLASALKVDKSVFIDQLGELGFEGVSLDSIMAGETAALVAQEYGFEPTVESGGEQDLKARPPPADPSSLPPRPPVVTIMGHVDHGKTTLLDYLRKSSVAAQEHGGITQHIGAFSVKMSTGKQMTFLDTPGHAAFLTMRQRGANVTDIVVLVVAADDSVKPQTIEAIKHARAAKVPIIVAINKIDKEGARIDQVKSDLARNGVEIEDYGGDVQVACVSGKTGRGMEDLEENILTLSEILDMRAEDDGPAEGWILESSLKPIGKAATILVKRGTLRPGDYIAAGITFAKIRHMRNEAGIDIDEAPPGTPVEILGWRDLPAAGDEVIQAPDEKRARSAVGYREGLREREKDAADHEKISVQRKALQEQRQAEKATEGHTNKRQDGTWGTTEQTPDTEGGAKMVNFVVKGDVHGSVEAVCACILEIGSHEVRPRILRSVPGHITESDVEHAATSKSIIVNFNLPLSGIIKRQAEEAGVKILEHTVIYHLADDVKDTLSGYLSAEVSFKVNGEAEVLQVFPINVKGRKYKNIAGCRIRNGKVEKNDLLRVFRDGEQIFEGQMESLKHGKKDITDARKGGECGIGFEFFTDLKQGDLIQAVEEITTERTL